MKYKAKYPIYVAKIKVVEKRWHGWSPEGSTIPPVESLHEKPSESRLIVSKETHKMDSIWNDEDQKVENRLSADYLQKEGFRIFISWKVPTSVNFTPEVTLEPISGSIYPVRPQLPLKNEQLKVGESFEIKSFFMDAGVTYTVTLVDIYKGGDYQEVQYMSDPTADIKDSSVIIEQF